MKEFWDEDIAALKLGDDEKNGLQVFRNYQKAFDKRASEQFIAEINLASFDLTPLDGILNLIGKEDIRFLPVFFCSFADEQLERMFRQEIPETVPSGRASMLSGFGGLSRLSQRIQTAYAFNWMTTDILLELDKLRKIRNETSHSWDVEVLRSKLNLLVDGRMHQLEKELGDGVNLPENFWEPLSKDSIPRIRLVWLAGRCFYESKLYPQVVKRRLHVFQTLYGEHKPQLLANISNRCLSATKVVISTDNTKSAINPP
jgi:hypothetical protein